MADSKFIIYTDASQAGIGEYGKLRAGFRIGLYVPETGEEFRSVNMKVQDSWAAETFGLLKAVEKAAELSNGRPILIRADGGSPETTKHKQANKYVWVMNKIIKENDLDVEFEFLSSGENLADRVSRTASDEYIDAVKTKKEQREKAVAVEKQKLLDAKLVSAKEKWTKKATTIVDAIIDEDDKKKIKALKKLSVIAKYNNMPRTHMYSKDLVEIGQGKASGPLLYCIAIVARERLSEDNEDH